MYGIIEDDVEIGVGCIIDWGVMYDIVLGKGMWIDNFVYVGYDIIIGKNCLIVV